MEPITVQVKEALDRVPRVTLGCYPTPFEHLPRLSAGLGREVFVKRDDGIGPGLGGNKTRKLEFLLAEALNRRERKVVTFGGLQSNHARLTAAAARKLGLEAHLFYFDRRPAVLRGNLALNRLLGAHLHFIPFGGGEDGSLTLETTNRLVHWLAWARVGRHYFIPVGGHSWLGCLGYVQAAMELDEQARQAGLGDARVIVAAGTGGTLAGLWAGFELTSSPLKVLGIDVGKLWKGFPASIARLAGEICTRLGRPELQDRFTPSAVPLVESTYADPCYGKPSPRCIDALHRLADLEGLLLDPIYTAKAFGGLLDLHARGRLGQNEPLIFLHTGGLPGLFAFDGAALGLSQRVP